MNQNDYVSQLNQPHGPGGYGGTGATEKLPAPERPRSAFNMVGEMGPLFAALAEAQGDFPEITKNESADAGKYTYSYADLSTIIKACKGPLKKNGLAIIHPPSGRRDAMTMRALLTHSSGAYLECIVELKPKDDSIQALGSEMTYMRRYTYMALAGVFPAEEDDDGAAADGKQQAHGPRANTRPTPPPVQQQARPQTKAQQAPKPEPKPAAAPESENIVIGPDGEVLETAPAKPEAAKGTPKPASVPPPPASPPERTVELDPAIAESRRRQAIQAVGQLYMKAGFKTRGECAAFAKECVGAEDLRTATLDQVEKVKAALEAKVA